MIVYFAHGKESGPWGTKIQFLANEARQLGFDVESLDYTHTMDPDERVALLVAALQKEPRPVFLVGSSMGGYVSLKASEQVDVLGLFLMAPAFYMQGYDVDAAQHRQQAITIVHGWQDNIVPPENPIRFAKASRCNLHVLDSDHRLNNALEAMKPWFLESLKAAQMKRE